MHHFRESVIIVALSCALLHAAEELTPWNGFYTQGSDSDGAFFAYEILELRDGRYNYWYFTDAIEAGAPKYPITGPYSIDGRTLKLQDHGEKILEPLRILAEVNGVRIIRNRSAQSYWDEERALSTGETLLQTKDIQDAKSEHPYPKKRESLKPLQTAIDDPVYQGRFNDLPEPSRTLFRAYSEREDRDRVKFFSELDQFLRRPSATIYEQLLTVLSSENEFRSRRAEKILAHLLRANRKQIEPFIAAIPFAKVKSSVETALFLFMTEMRLKTCDLEIPEGGVHIHLELLKYDQQNRQSRVLLKSPPTREDWSDKIELITPKCQQWCREQVDKEKRQRFKEPQF